VEEEEEEEEEEEQGEGWRFGDIYIDSLDCDCW
jgi:hypothetical protein